MLTELSIRNLAVIESVTLRFVKGFQVMTGETGAGKSILVDALGLIAGGRGSVDLVRHGKDKAEIEAMFDCPANHPVWDILARNGIEGDTGEPLIFRREMTMQGKSSARVNGQLVNLSMLRDIGESLINIHGQHEHQSLLKVEQHLQLLDNFGGAELQELKRRYQDLYRTFTKLRKERSDVREQSQRALQMGDLYRFQAEEIEKAKLKTGEDESLQEERRKLANAEKLYDAVSGAYDEVYGNQQGLDLIARSMEKLKSVSGLDPELSSVSEQVQNAYYQLEDAAFQLRDYREQIEFNPERLGFIEERLDLLHGLKRKYGADVGEVLAHLDKIKSELSAIDNRDAQLAEMDAQLENLEGQLTDLAGNLTALRRSKSEALSRQIERELAALHMDRTKFEVRLGRLPSGGPAGAFNQDGWDTAEFMISPNPGEPLKPLGKIASGGELSRMMLALKSIFAQDEQIPVLVFDEVDTGVSGKAAQAIAEKLAALSAHCQVFSITHLPQVASMADAHYLIEKTVSGGRTHTQISPLTEPERISELARMIGGTGITQTAEIHAKELLEMAKNLKGKQHLKV